MQVFISVMGLNTWLSCVQTQVLTEAGYQMGLENIRVSGIQKEECCLNYLHMRETEKQKDKEGGAGSK